jgi:hypothetical protein
MQNVGGEQFDYDTFVAAYETDPRVKTMVANFNKKGIVPKTATQDPTEAPQGDTQDGGNTVSSMAKRATDVGADL